MSERAVYSVFFIGLCSIILHLAIYLNSSHMLFYTPPSPKVQLAPISYGVAESLVLDRFDSIAHGHYLRLSASFDWDFETIKKYVPADAVTLRCTPSHIELVSETDYLNLFDASHDGKLAQQDANRLCAVVLQRLNALQAKG